MRAPAIRHRNERRDRPECVARRDVERQRRVAERELLAVGRHHVPLRLRAGAAIEQVPVGGGKDDPGPEVILEVLGATRMVAVPVAHNRVLDLRWVESQLLQAADDLVFDRVVEDGVDEDDPGRRRHGPGGEFGLADEVQIVEYLHRFDVPLRSIRRTGWRPSCWRGRLRRGGRRLAQLVEHEQVILPCGGLRGRDVRVGRRLRRRDGDASGKRERCSRRHSKARPRPSAPEGHVLFRH